MVQWRIQVFLDVTLCHTVSGGRCVLGTCHLHPPQFRGHEECQGVLRGANVQARSDPADRQVVNQYKDVGQAWTYNRWGPKGGHNW